MEQLFFAGKAYLKINSLVKTPLHEFMVVECSGLWAPDVYRVAGMIASIRGKEPHIYRVIILKQIADHS